MDRDASITLLSAILAGTPRLPGTACLGHHQLDDESPGRVQLDQRRGTR
jgi:hypothetical protein